MEKGRLILLPSSLGEDGSHVIPEYVKHHVAGLKFIVAEKAKSARRFLKQLLPSLNLQEVTVMEIDKHDENAPNDEFFKPILQGFDVGLVSEAGCPGVADPGAAIVLQAHLQEIEVVPLVGPSSILLALMASGMNGQSFCFHGYLPAQKNELDKALQRLEQNSLRQNQTQLFIETPYRNNQVFETALNALHSETLFGIAVDLTLPSQVVKTLRILDWKKLEKPGLHKRPCVFSVFKKS